MDTNPFLEPVNLVKCVIQDGAGRKRSRYIEVEQYRLWHYLVTNKHGLHVEEKARCLWLPNQAYEANVESYHKGGEVAVVDRIIISLYHAQFGYDTILQRFAIRSDTQALFNILKSHLSHEEIEGKATGSEVIPGHAVEHLDANGQFRRLASVP